MPPSYPARRRRRAEPCRISLCASGETGGVARAGKSRASCTPGGTLIKSMTFSCQNLSSSPGRGQSAVPAAPRAIAL